MKSIILDYKTWILNEQAGDIKLPATITAIVRDSNNGNEIAKTKVSLYDNRSYSVDTHKLNIPKEIKRVSVFFMLNGFAADVKSELNKKSKSVSNVSLEAGEQVILQDVYIRQPGALDGNSWAVFTMGNKDVSFSIWDSGGKPEGE